MHTIHVLTFETGILYKIRRLGLDIAWAMASRHPRSRRSVRAVKYFSKKVRHLRACNEDLAFTVRFGGRP